MPTPVLLPTTDYHLLRPLIEPLNYHLALAALLAGEAPAQVFVDSPLQPQSALVWIVHRCFLLGAPDNTDFNRALDDLFRTSLYAAMGAHGQEMFGLYYGSDGWAEQFATIFPDREPVPVLRQYYELTLDAEMPQVTPPVGCELAPVDAALLARPELDHLDQLREELCSERPTVEEFLHRSFGVCFVVDNELVGWCLSEYNCHGCCEVGIETVDAYRRRGYGVALTGAFATAAQSHGIHQIGWHCIARNVASAATARKAGFAWQCDYPSALVWIDPVENLAVHGNVLFWDAQYAAALSWFERAIATGAAPAWALWRGGCAAAMAGELDQAIDYLSQAIALGYPAQAELQDSPYLIALRTHSRWPELLAGS